MLCSQTGQHFTMWHSIEQCCAVVCSIVYCCAVLRSVVQCCSVLCIVVQCCVLLCSIKKCCAELCSVGSVVLSYAVGQCCAGVAAGEGRTLDCVADMEKDNFH